MSRVFSSRSDACVASAEEELEPLFSYTTVLPVDLLAFQDDRFDCSPAFLEAKRRKTSNPSEGRGKDGDDNVVLLDDVEWEKKAKVDAKVGLEEDEDWLALPPPRVPNSGLEFKEDEMLRKLRLQKQELVSLTQSVQDILQKVAETAEKEISDSRKFAPEVMLDQISKPQVGRPKILISIQDKDGQKQFRMYSDDKFEKLFKMYAEKVQLKLESLIFTFDGDKVSPKSTPEVLGLENDDIVEVHVRSL